MVPQIQGHEKLSLEDLNAIIDRAMTGDESTLPTIKQWLDKDPTIWLAVCGLAKRVESAWIQAIAKQDLITREALERQVIDLKRTLQAEYSSPLEHLIIDTITTTWLAWKQAQLSAAQQIQRYGNTLTQAQQNHLTACQKRYLLAVKELARIRQLLTPRTTTVVNIADKQQVNLT